MDLAFLSKGKNHAGKWVWEDQRRRVYKGTSGGECICFSGCDDSQTSADTSSLSGDSTSTGAVTFAFIKAIEEAIAARRPATYDSLMGSMNRTLRPSGGSGGGRYGGGGGSIFGLGGGGLLDMFYGGGNEPYRRSGFTQVPQISASHPFDMNRPFHM
jgi:hypothetical protein